MCKGGYVVGPEPAEFYKAGLLELLASLKDDAISVVDSIAPTDFITNSPLGMKDGDVYKHLQSWLVQSPAVFERPAWWKDVVDWKSYVTAKL